MEKIRLQKFFTDNKIMSRRSAEKVIEAGNVKINGTIAKLGDKVDPENDIVEYNGKITIAVRPMSDSAGGADKLGLDALQALSVEGYSTANEISTETESASINNMLETSVLSSEDIDIDDEER